MASKMEPEGTLKNNSGLTEMREWRETVETMDSLLEESRISNDRSAICSDVTWEV